jgi:hypothetical protein
MNRSAVWSNTTYANKWLGFSACLTGITDGKTYYVGVGGDNEYKLVLDGVTLIDTTQWSSAPIFPPVTDKFRYWNVYPVYIEEGLHVLELFGIDYGTAGGIGVEIYDNTYAELIAATDITDLDIVFTTSGYTVAPVIQNNSGLYISSGYTCPIGYVYSECDNACIKYDVCCSGACNCIEINVSQLDLDLAIGNTFSFEKYDGAVVLNVNNCGGNGDDPLIFYSAGTYTYCVTGVNTGPSYYTYNSLSAATNTAPIITGSTCDNSSNCAIYLSNILQSCCGNYVVYL